jgi:hypothetical protein
VALFPLSFLTILYQLQARDQIKWKQYVCISRHNMTGNSSFVARKQTSQYSQLKKKKQWLQLL